MQGYGRQNRYKIIKQAIENEIYIDKYLIEKFALKKNIAVFKNARFKDKLPLWLSIFLLPFIPLYYLTQIWISLKSKSPPIRLKENSLFLSFTRSPKIAELYKSYASDLPYIQCIEGSKLHFAKQLAYMQLFNSYFLALAYFLKYIVTSHPRSYLHAINIYELILFLFFLDKIKSQGVNSFTLTNHYDRWITLIAEYDSFQINVIQHGIIDGNYEPKYKIKNVRSIRVYNDSQLKIFKEKIYYNDVIDISYIKNNLSIDYTDRCEFLIISNPFFIDDELKIYNRLKNKKFDVKFRPHPLYLNDKIKQIIDEKDLCLGTRLPAPKFCICRSSTLGNEYEMMGYKIIWWDENTTFESIMAVVRE